MRRDRSIDAEYFENMYRANADPWQFGTSDYEAAKYAHTLVSLPREQFGSALEIGCSIGVLTERLAPRCHALLAVDVSETAIHLARRRCRALSNISFAARQVPADEIEGSFDLILLSEVVYYWDSVDLQRFAKQVRRHARIGCHLLLVHWTRETDYPKSGDEAVTELRSLLAAAIKVVNAERRPNYRLDLWRWVS